MSDPPERSLEEVEKRIGELKSPPKADLSLGRGMALVFTLGVSVAASLWGSYMAGQWLDRKFSVQYYTPLMVLVGLGAAAWIGYRLMKPLLKD